MTATTGSSTSSSRPSAPLPIVTVLDGRPHTLSFCAAIQGQRAVCLGVQDFGQSGNVRDLYRHFRIDTDTIVGTAYDAIESED